MGGGCVSGFPLLPSFILSSAPVCKMSLSLVLPCQRPQPLLPCLGGPQPRCSVPLPPGNQDKGIIFGTGAVTQQMHYLSLGVKERRRFAGLLILALDWRASARVCGHGRVAHGSCARLGVLVCVRVRVCTCRGACRGVRITWGMWVCVWAGG